MEKVPGRLQAFMNAAMRELRHRSLVEMLECWAINEDEYQDIKDWFEKQGIKV